MPPHVVDFSRKRDRCQNPEQASCLAWGERQGVEPTTSSCHLGQMPKRHKTSAGFLSERSQVRLLVGAPGITVDLASVRGDAIAPAPRFAPTSAPVLSPPPWHAGAMRKALAVLVLAVLSTATALADSETKCRRDSGGHLVCVKVEREKAEKCQLTCRKDSGGKTICRERCR